jgi:hypothetical protein
VRLSPDEQLAFEKIKAISRRDPKFLKDIFISLLKMVTLETYAAQNDNSFVFHIPYLCQFKATYINKIKYTAEGNQKGMDTDIQIEAIPSESFIAEIKALVDGDVTPSERYIEKQIVGKVASILEIEDLDIEM